MPTLLVHPDVATHLSKLDISIRDFVRQKVSWSEMQLAMIGRVSRVKGTRTQAWRRTPVRGNQYYLWWAPADEVGATAPNLGPAIAVRDLRHHDDLSPPAPAQRSDYEIIHPRDLDPRTNIQTSVAKAASHTGVSATIVRGQPGTGKTLSLLYAARDITASQRVLYVTYTPQLVEDALIFAKTVGIGDSLVVMTLSSVVGAILSDPPGAKTEDPGALARGFEGLVQSLDNSVVGAWANKGQALWAETRANLVGMALPFAWKRGPRSIPSCELLELGIYRDISGLERDPAEKARHIADLARRRGLLSDQTRARAALDSLIKGDAGQLALEGVQAVVLDEVQDLTPIELALLLEVTRCIGHKHPAARFIAAGDESQTVHPSGFEWGIAKDLIRERLGREPKDIGLGQMMRNPGVIHAIIKKTSSLYKTLPKTFRPSGVMADDTPPVQDIGQVFRCMVPKGHHGALLDALVATPGRAMVRLERGQNDGKLQDKKAWGAVTFTPAEIKGLERRIVVVSGLDETLNTITRLTQCDLRENRSLESLEARYLIDGVRVALSRATDTLIVVENQSTPDGPSLLPTGLLDGAESINWDELVVLLEKDDLSDEERAYGFFAEAREFVQRGETARALERLERAEAIGRNLSDASLSRMISELREELEKKAGLRIIVGPDDSLQDAIDKAPDGASIIVRPGTYTGPFLIEKNLKIIGDGPLKEVVLEGDLGVVLIGNGAVTLEGLNIFRRTVEGTPHASESLFKQVGRWAARSFGRDKIASFMKELGTLFLGDKLRVGIAIVNGKLEVQGCDIHGENAVGIMASAARVRVDRCTVHDASDGIFATLKSSMTIERTEVRDTDLGIQSHGNVRLVVRDSTVSNAGASAVSLGTGTEALIENNVIRGAKIYGIFVYMGVEAMVRKNRIHRCYGGIRLSENAGGVYEDNDIFESAHVGFWGTANCDPTVINNRVRNGGTYGIFLDRTAGGRYEDNQIIGNGQAGFMISGQNRIVVRNSLIQGNASSDPSVFIGPDAIGIFESNEVCNQQGMATAVQVDAGAEFVVRKNRIHHNPRQGLMCRGVGCLFEENEVYQIVNVAVHVERNAKPTMVRNHIHHNGFGIVISDGSAGVYEDNDIHTHKDIGVHLHQTTGIFRRNRIRQCAIYAVLVDGGSDALFEENDISDSGTLPECANVAVHNGANPVFRNNTIHGAAIGMAFSKNSQGLAEGNDVASSSRIGVVVNDGSKAILRENRIHSSKQHGIVVENADPTIENNEVFKNQFVGIRTSSNEVVIRNNRIHGNLGGIDALSKKGTFERNQILYNLQWGIRVAEGSNPNVQGNLVQGSPVGMVLCKKASGTYVKNDLRGNMQVGLLIDPNAAPIRCDENSLDEPPMRGPTDKHHWVAKSSPGSPGKKKGRGK